MQENFEKWFLSKYGCDGFDIYQTRITTIFEYFGFDYVHVARKCIYRRHPPKSSYHFVFQISQEKLLYQYQAVHATFTLSQMITETPFIRMDEFGTSKAIYFQISTLQLNALWLQFDKISIPKALFLECCQFLFEKTKNSNELLMPMMPGVSKIKF